MTGVLPDSSNRDGRHPAYSRAAAVEDARAVLGNSSATRRADDRELRPIAPESRTRAKRIHERIAVAAFAVACPLRTIDKRSNYAVAVFRLSVERARKVFDVRVSWHLPLVSAPRGIPERFLPGLRSAETRRADEHARRRSLVLGAARSDREVEAMVLHDLRQATRRCRDDAACPPPALWPARSTSQYDVTSTERSSAPLSRRGR
jgi:hypothetical protein